MGMPICYELQPAAECIQTQDGSGRLDAKINQGFKARQKTPDWLEGPNTSIRSVNSMKSVARSKKVLVLSVPRL